MTGVLLLVFFFYQKGDVMSTLPMIPSTTVTSEKTIFTQPASTTKAPLAIGKI